MRQVEKAGFFLSLQGIEWGRYQDSDTRVIPNDKARILEVCPRQRILQYFLAKSRYCADLLQAKLLCI